MRFFPSKLEKEESNVTEEMRRKLDFLKTCETGNVADAYVRLGLVQALPAYTVDSAQCRPLRMEDVFVGPAVPVQFTPSLPGQAGTGMFEVLAQAEAGSVILMAGIQQRCYMGDVLAQYAARQGIAAIAADGFVRDSKGCMAAGIPIFSRGGTTTAKGKGLYTITAVNESITFCNIQIYPGDIIMGDCDGIIRIPQSLFDDVYRELLQVMECEAEYARVLQTEGDDLLLRLKAVSAKSH